MEDFWDLLYQNIPALKHYAKSRKKTSPSVPWQVYQKYIESQMDGLAEKLIFLEHQRFLPAARLEQQKATLLKRILELKKKNWSSIHQEATKRARFSKVLYQTFKKHPVALWYFLGEDFLVNIAKQRVPSWFLKITNPRKKMEALFGTLDPMQMNPQDLRQRWEDVESNIQIPTLPDTSYLIPLLRDASLFRVDILDLNKMPLKKALQQLTKAYRQLVFQYHPDRNNGVGTDKIKEINEARTRLEKFLHRLR